VSKKNNIKGNSARRERQCVRIGLKLGQRMRHYGVRALLVFGPEKVADTGAKSRNAGAFDCVR